jgi:hypothetical protein
MNAPMFNSEDVAERAHRPSVQSVCDDLAFEAIVEACDLAGSYARSAAEAAWRGNHRLVERHLSELRLCVRTALAARKRLGKAEGAGRECARLRTQ